jgi:Zn finger protein HypA/HybF involved in hydrogenase expression
MSAMIVRCGRCRSELQVDGPGEFVCPVCGTRNAVRGAPGQTPLDLSSMRSPAPPSGAPAPGVTWIVCPSCSYRFAMGEREHVTCPNCRLELEVVEGTARAATP